MSDVNALYVITLLMSSLCAVHGYTAGAPVAQCNTMMPGHGANQPQVIDDNVPYTVTTSKATYTPGEQITVTVAGKEASNVFKGMMLTAGDLGTQLGTFSLMPNEDQLQLLACGGIDNTAVTHNGAAEKQTKSVYWTAPSSMTGPVTFRATVVQQFTVFYVGVLSDPVQFMAAPTTAAMDTTTVMMMSSTMQASNTTSQGDSGGASSIGASSGVIIAMLTTFLLALTRL